LKILLIKLPHEDEFYKDYAIDRLDSKLHYATHYEIETALNKILMGVSNIYAITQSHKIDEKLNIFQFVYEKLKKCK